MKVLILDDNETSLKLLEKLTESAVGCEAVPYSNPSAVLSAMPHIDFDVAVIDFQMPVYNGVEFLTEMLRFEKYENTPVIFVTGDTDVETRVTVLDAGVTDFITKPVEAQEFRMRLQNVVALAEARRQLADQAELMQQAVERGSLELREREREIIHRLIISAGYKDSDTASHNLRVAAFAEAIAYAYGMPEDDCNDLRLIAPLHDYGGATAPDRAMLKQGKMTEAVYKQNIRRNPIGLDIAAAGHKSLLSLITDIARANRERWDGQGLPNHLKEEEIPLGARIIAVADSFDKLTSERPFKTPWPIDRAVQHIRSRSGIQFDPACVRAFEDALPVIREIMNDGYAMGSISSKAS